jgi:hypothetical protein
MKKLILSITLITLFTACEDEFVRLGNPTTNLPNPTNNYAEEFPSALSIIQEDTIISNEFWKANPTWAGSSYSDSEAVIYIATINTADKTATISTTLFTETLYVKLNISNNGSFYSDSFLDDLNLISFYQDGTYKLMITNSDGITIADLFPIEIQESDKNFTNTEEMCRISSDLCFDIDNTLFTKQYFIAGYTQLTDKETKEICSLRIYDECTPDGKLKEAVCPSANNSHNYIIIDCPCQDGRCIGNPLTKLASSDGKKETLETAKENQPAGAANINQHLLNGTVYIP